MEDIEKRNPAVAKAMAGAVAVFGGGCFWCTEAVFKMMRGVTSVLPGYAGGTTENPTYAEVSEGTTGHAEVVRIEYDPAEVKYESLLTVFFGSHDPTTLNRQGADVGTQYRSVIFYTTDEQKMEAEKFIKDINESDVAPASAQGYGEAKPVVTEVVPLEKFYEAENYHKDYFANHPDAGYCQLVINPKLEKVQKQFANLLKDLDQQK
jgi:peptide-methionine (S)-S-oxide reductase